MATTTPTEMERKAGIWVTIWGVLLIIAGIIAIMQPAVAALGFSLVLAWIFVFAGVVQGVYAFQQRNQTGLAWKLLAAIATLVLGVIMLSNPIASIATLALVIGAFIFASGISSVMLGMRLKGQKGSGWVLFDGALSIVLALLIAMGWPENSIAFIGILVGICLISGGMWRIILGRALRADAAATA
ncbi:MAG: DUF308 domain-containing protein, partial [Betaproteobacteria bacterium]